MKPLANSVASSLLLIGSRMVCGQVASSPPHGNVGVGIMRPFRNMTNRSDRHGDRKKWRCGTPVSERVSRALTCLAENERFSTPPQAKQVSVRPTPFLN